MILGVLGIGYGFFTAPKNTQDVEALLAASHGEHGEASANHDTNAAQDVPKTEIAKQTVAISTDSTAKNAVKVEEDTKDSVVVGSTVASSELPQATKHDVKTNHETAAVDAHAEHKEHIEHVYHQLTNKPWSALYVAALFFMLMSLGVLTFYAIQHAAQAGWSPVLYRVMEALTAYLVPGSIIVFVILVLSSLHFNHLFVWMDPEVVKHDALIQGKTGYLNVPFFLIRAVIFMGGWIAYRHFSRKNSLLLDETHDVAYYKKNFKLSAGYLAFFLVSESMMSWDWIMSVDPHWYSTLFGWYVFASFFVSGITAIALTTLYLRSRGYLEYVNDSHMHDLAKFMFGISVFWTYLWFSQFMLMWYANIPEETIYFTTRLNGYPVMFYLTLIINFVIPFLVLLTRNSKRVVGPAVAMSILLIFGHWMDFFSMVVPELIPSGGGFGIIGLGAFVAISSIFGYILLAQDDLLQDS